MGFYFVVIECVGEIGGGVLDGIEISRIVSGFVVVTSCVGAITSDFVMRNSINHLSLCINYLSLYINN